MMLHITTGSVLRQQAGAGVSSRGRDSGQSAVTINPPAIFSDISMKRSKASSADQWMAKPGSRSLRAAADS